MTRLTFMRRAKDMLPVSDLRYLLHHHLHTQVEARGVQRVHASALTSPDTEFCPRFYALARATGMKLPQEWISTSESVTFHLGLSLQEAVVNWFAEMGRAVGHWVCQGCDKMQMFCLRPKECPQCGAVLFRPEEVRFESALTGASCGLDLLANVGGPKLRLVEIKTMAAEQFKGLVAPLAEHRLRTSLYLRIVEESAHEWTEQIETSRADVLYVSKSGYGCAVDDDFKKLQLNEYFSPFKCYPVVRDDVATEKASRMAQTVKMYSDGEIGMPCGICATAMTERAKKCPAAKICFSGDFPAEYAWQGSL
jgi:hypothetical protein